MRTAACVAILTTDKKYIRVVNRPNSTIPALPGGKHDPGETIVETAIRETWEETGLTYFVDQLTELHTEVCEGEVDYLVTCFVAYDDNTNTTKGIEPDIHSYVMPIDEFLKNNAFMKFNMNALGKLL